MSAPPVSVGRPAITFTRIAIVVLAALLAFNAVSRAITQSTVPPNPRPTTVLGSPLTGESPAAAAPPTETLPAITPGPSFGPTSARDFATVTKIIDGDTIQVDMSGKDYTVDYIGIDAPEPDAADPTVRAQAASATATNAALVEGHDVYLEHDVSDTDGSDRLLRNVWFVDSGGSNVLVNLELVRLGFAKVLTVEPDHKYVAYLATAENAARSEHLGIWSSAASTSGDGAPAAVPSPPGPPPSG
jgi:micrococcal nuclease